MLFVVTVPPKVPSPWWVSRIHGLADHPQSALASDIVVRERIMVVAKLTKPRIPKHCHLVPRRLALFSRLIPPSPNALQLRNQSSMIEGTIFGASPACIRKLGNFAAECYTERKGQNKSFIDHLTWFSRWIRTPSDVLKDTPLRFCDCSNLAVFSYR
jgi:hypothetical protein